MGMNDNWGIPQLQNQYQRQQLPSMMGNNNYQNQQQQQQMPAKVLRGYAVTSIDEARAATVETDGVICFLPDLANGRIYTKQLNPDGTATFNMYEQKPIPEPPSYVTRDEFNVALSQVKELLQQLLAPATAAEVATPQKTADTHSQETSTSSTPTSNEIVI